MCSPSPRTLAGHPLRHGRDPAAHDETPVVVAGDVGLDDHVLAAALAERLGPRGADVLLGAQVQRDAPPVVAVERLDHARVAEPARGRHRVVLGLDDLGARDRQAGRVEQAVGELLVARDVDGDPGGPARHRGADPLLVDALAELDEAVAVEADVRDVAAGGLVEERLGAGPEREPLGEQDELFELRDEVERERLVARGHEMVHERDGHPPRLDADLLLAVLEDHVVPAGLAGAARLAVTDVRPREVLELERDVLGDVARPRPLPESRDEPAPATEAAGVILERGQHLRERVREARDLVARELLEDAEVDDLADHGLAGPVVRPAEDARLEDPQGGLGTAGADRVGRTAALALGLGCGGDAERGRGPARRRFCGGGDRCAPFVARVPGRSSGSVPFVASRSTAAASASATARAAFFAALAFAASFPLPDFWAFATRLLLASKSDRECTRACSPSSLLARPPAGARLAQRLNRAAAAYFTRRRPMRALSGLRRRRSTARRPVRAPTASFSRSATGPDEADRRSGNGGAALGAPGAISSRRGRPGSRSGGASRRVSGGGGRTGSPRAASGARRR